ncbi:MAG TPA: DUF819 family protein, partial [Syntrophales bacterium]|nr:DUF819 family protein [Syntrophales bacterium]
MITDPLGIAAVLIAIIALVIFSTDLPYLRKACSFLPPVFWIYFLPMLAATAGILPRESAVYPFITSNFLPASLILLLISSDIRGILRLGPAALLMMLAGSLGIIIGGPIVILLFKPWLPEGIWSGFGALSGSWIGGSANMIAVKEGIGTPDHIFFPIVVLDTILSYSWMGLVIAVAAFQGKYDLWNRSRKGLIDNLCRGKKEDGQGTRSVEIGGIALLFGTALAASWLSSAAASHLPEIRGAVTHYTWTIIIASLGGAALSATRLRKLESYGASKVGYAMLYLVLASIGVRGDLAHIAAVPVLIIAGVAWLLIHASVLFAASRLLRTPLFFVAVASQANVGGPVSAPVVAEIYRPGLAAVGVLMAVIGNISGTFLGILCAQ